MFARDAGFLLRGARHRQTAPIGAPLRPQLGPGQRLRFTRSRGLLRGCQLRLRQPRRAINNGQIVRRPLPQRRAARRPGSDRCRIDTGDLGHPRAGVHRTPFHPDQAVQFVAQRGLIDDPRRAGFVEQTGAVNRHQPAISAGLPIRHQHVGVQVRIPRPRGLMLIGRGHQTGQLLEVFFSRHRVVHPGVAGMRGEVLQSFRDRRLVRRSDRFITHIAAEHPSQRHRFRRAKRQIEPVHPALAMRPTTLPRRRHTLVQPARHHIRISIPTGPLSGTQTNQLRDRRHIPRARPDGGAGVTFGVVLGQPSVGFLPVRHGVADCPRGVVVIVHRPQRQLRHRQHPYPPPPRPDPARNHEEDHPERNRHHQHRTNLCKCAVSLR
ncbi:Uncharacterised protein [Mycobacteroides abscessus subsp. abscessus]|nr:Uncharacterised protein [Mycobacteroides abscessus subsp. abscessus]